jgi:hypothetical protein
MAEPTDTTESPDMANSNSILPEPNPTGPPESDMNAQVDICMPDSTAEEPGYSAVTEPVSGDCESQPAAIVGPDTAVLTTEPCDVETRVQPQIEPVVNTPAELGVGFELVLGEMCNPDSEEGQASGHPPSDRGESQHSDVPTYDSDATSWKRNNNQDVKMCSVDVPGNANDASHGVDDDVDDTISQNSNSEFEESTAKMSSSEYEDSPAKKRVIQKRKPRRQLASSKQKRQRVTTRPHAKDSARMQGFRRMADTLISEETADTGTKSLTDVLATMNRLESQPAIEYDQEVEQKELTDRLMGIVTRAPKKPASVQEEGRQQVDTLIKALTSRSSAVPERLGTFELVEGSKLWKVPGMKTKLKHFQLFGMTTFGRGNELYVI